MPLPHPQGETSWCSIRQDDASAAALSCCEAKEISLGQASYRVSSLKGMEGRDPFWGPRTSRTNLSLIIFQFWPNFWHLRFRSLFLRNQTLRLFVTTWGYSVSSQNLKPKFSFPSSPSPSHCPPPNTMGQLDMKSLHSRGTRAGSKQCESKGLPPESFASVGL